MLVPVVSWFGFGAEVAGSIPIYVHHTLQVLSPHVCPSGLLAPLHSIRES
jgi:hypothetical protein